MKIAVVGAGFVGQATGKGLAKHNNDIVFIDVDERRVDELREEGYEARLNRDYKTINTDVTMMSVPTPTRGGRAQLDYIRDAVISFALRLANHNHYHVLVIRSTVPPGTIKEFIIPLVENTSGKKAGRDFGVVMQPEYLREATADEDFARPWFILIGADDKKAGDVIEKIYRSFDVPIERCTIEEAELQKYVHNVFNAVKIAFFNEMRVAINKLGHDTEKIFLATAQSCEGIWNPIYGLKDYGPFDGSCLPKDTQALLEWGARKGFNFGILRSVIEENRKHEMLLGKNTKVAVNYLAAVEA